MSEWQPIETAPKDGTVIRGKNDAWETHALQSIQRIRWDRFLNGWSLEHRYLTLKGRTEAPDPTHWMPLPEPPK